MKKSKTRINTSKVVIIFSLILIVVIVLYTSLNSGIFNSDNIEIEGNKYVESEYIIKALEVNNNKNIFRYNIKDMEEILLNNKYIDKVEIKRLLPNTLKVSIIEKEIVANLYNDEIYCYIDKEGNFIDEIDDNNKDNEESSFDENSEYNKCLNLNNDGMMGYISIPKIDVKLPIYHSTDNEVLQKYVGHLEGSSLPVGGKSTHGVLAAHRGLPSSRLFTDLDRIEEGDRFYIYVLNQVLTYQVDRIYPMIDKNDKAKLTEALQTKEGEDYITLLTCTPYGVNTHRLLVRGKRVENSNESYDRKLNSNSNLWILGGAAVGIIATSVVLVILIRKGEKADWRSIAKAIREDWQNTYWASIVELVN